MCRSILALGLGVLAPGVAFTTTSLVHTRPAAASPTNDSAVWSWGNLRVERFREATNGDVIVRFTNANGAVFTNWDNQAGVNQCPGDAYLRVHEDHPRRERLSEVLLAAHLSQRPVHVWFEGVDGICYVKGVDVSI